MRFFIPLLFASAIAAQAQDSPLSPNQELQSTVSGWIDAMQKIQQEENDWSRDQEVLQHYKEGLEKEISDLKEKITAARTRAQGADQDSLSLQKKRDQYLAARDRIKQTVIDLETRLAARLPAFPAPLMADPKVAQMARELRQARELPEEKQSEGLSKRLLNAINLLTEAEKFQQTIHVREELHPTPEGGETKVQVVYFGLAAAYGVSADQSLAVVGAPTASGWKFTPKPELAADIRRLVSATIGEADAAFVNLPLPTVQP